jgi:hypothetical protein
MKKTKSVLIILAALTLIACSMILCACNGGKKAQEEADKAAQWAVEQISQTNVTQSITLPSKYPQNEDVKLTWKSDSDDIIGGNGAFTAPQSDTQVKLTCTAEYKGKKASKDITVTAKAQASQSMPYSKGLIRPYYGLNGNVNNGATPYSNGLNGNVNNGVAPYSNGFNGNVNNGATPYSNGFNGNVNNGAMPYSNGFNGNVNNGLAPYSNGFNGNVNNGATPYSNGFNGNMNNGATPYSNGMNGDVNNAARPYSNGMNGNVNNAARPYSNDLNGNVNNGGLSDNGVGGRIDNGNNGGGEPIRTLPFKRPHISGRTSNDGIL